MYNKIQIWRHKIPLSTRLVESVFSLQLSTSELVKSTLLPTKIPTPPLPKTGKDRPRFSYMNISITVHRIPSCIFSYNFNICGIFFHVMKLCRHVKNMTVTSALCESWRKMKKNVYVRSVLKYFFWKSFSTRKIECCKMLGSQIHTFFEIEVIIFFPLLMKVSSFLVRFSCGQGKGVWYNLL